MIVQYRRDRLRRAHRVAFFLSSAVMPGAILIGARGALGSSIHRRLVHAGWAVIGVDINTGSSVKSPDFVEIERNQDLQTQFNFINECIGLSGARADLRAVINVSGGFRMDTAASVDMFNAYDSMCSSSFSSSILATRLAATHLSSNGLLILPGAAAAEIPTPWAVSYGASKAAVHHMVRSLAAEGSGLPCTCIGLAPVMLDTEMNRRDMPEADRSSWTSLDEISNFVSDNLENSKNLINGKIYKIITKNFQTEFVPT
jgi:dihydropteridine reductase